MQGFANASIALQFQRVFGGGRMVKSSEPRLVARRPSSVGMMGKVTPCVLAVTRPALSIANSTVAPVSRFK